MWTSVVVLCVALAAAMLMPATAVSNEILLRYPHDYYVQWLSEQLISRTYAVALSHGPPVAAADLARRGLRMTVIWDEVFVSSVACMFFLVPFAYFYGEAGGLTFVWSPFPRVVEAAVVQLLFTILVASAWHAHARDRTPLCRRRRCSRRLLMRAFHGRARLRRLPRMHSLHPHCSCRAHSGPLSWVSSHQLCRVFRVSLLVHGAGQRRHVSRYALVPARATHYRTWMG